MNLTSDMKCVNCGATLTKGGTQIAYPEIIHWRRCTKCNLKYCIFQEHPEREYSLYSERKNKGD